MFSEKVCFIPRRTEHLLALRRLCVSVQNKPFRFMIVRALKMRISKRKIIPEFVTVKQEIDDEFQEDSKKT